MSSLPTIMVSSTFYDLRQVRTDLYNFIASELGYNPLLSEFPSFPIDPDSDTIENCQNRVEQQADIMVLIIGGRYGSIDSKSNNSITNLEFLAARTKGIPIYVFISSSILANYPIWKANPETDFSSVVDSSRLFEFVETIREKERIWSLEFDTAQDIINALRKQFAYLFHSSLQFRHLLNGSSTPQFMNKLKPKSFRLALEKPDYWEYKLFYQSWIDEVDRRNDLLREYEAGLQLDNVQFIQSTQANKWFQTQLDELHNLVESASLLVNTHANHAFGEPGEPGDAEQIVWVTGKLGQTFEQVLHWAIKIRCTKCEPPYDLLVPEVALFGDDLIKQFISHPKESLTVIEEAISSIDTNEPKSITLMMTLSLANQDRFNKKLEEINKYYNPL